MKELEKKGEIKPGDLLYWDFEGDDRINHATMITNVENGNLQYSGHTLDRFNADVKKEFESWLEDGFETKLHIVKMKDQIEVK